MNHHWINTIALCSLAVLSSCGAFAHDTSSSDGGGRGLSRQKRVIGGESMEDRDDVPYKVIEYYVWIGHIWNCFEDLPWWKKAMWFTIPEYGFASYLFRPCPEKPEHLTCGGALIAPRIVQTACHCLADFVPRGNRPWGRTQLHNSFEQQKQIYMGKVDVTQFDYPILSESFGVHPKCGELQVKKGQGPRMHRFDIGWIVLLDEVPYSKGVPRTWGQLDYAGPYRRQAVIDKYNQVIGQRRVCLLVGFGDDDKGRAARYMRQAWIQILDAKQCYQVTHGIRGHQSIYVYNNSATWVCAQQMPKVSYNSFRGIDSSGDSGSPITCDNNYFAVVSGVQKFKKLRVGFTEMILETAIKYALEAMTVETRRDFEKEMLENLVVPISTVTGQDLRILNPTQKQLVKHKI